jgi:hypothetical protein
MNKHFFHRVFRDLLSLHGYPLPFESIERIAGEAETPDYSRRYGNDAASARSFCALGGPAGAKTAAGAACATGGCA